MTRTTISLPLDVKKRLTFYGNMNDSYADVIVMLMDKFDEFEKLNNNLIIKNEEMNNSNPSLKIPVKFSEVPDEDNEITRKTQSTDLEKSLSKSKKPSSKGKKTSKIKSLSEGESSKSKKSSSEGEDTSKSKRSSSKDKTSKSKRSSSKGESSKGEDSKSESKHRDLTENGLDDEIKKLEELYHIKL